MSLLWKINEDWAWCEVTNTYWSKGIEYTEQEYNKIKKVNT